MNIQEKIRVLSESAKWDTCASTATPRTLSKAQQNAKRIGSPAAGGLCHSFGPDGRCISLFKTLYTNSCSYDCAYCENSSSCKKNLKKAAYTPEQLAKVTINLYVRNYIEGIFLSSGVMKDPDHTTEQLVESIKLLRNKYNFAGYIHLKIIPGTSYDLIKQCSQLADRLSLNLEAPNKSRLSEISSVKDFKVDILRRQAWMKRMPIPSGQTTQLVVGSSDETDKEILSSINWEYENFNLKRGYYSAFNPIDKTPLSTKKSTPLQREHRLYNVDFMLRQYKIKLREFNSVMDDGMLPKEDPKVALARNYFDGPVDVNETSFKDLIRVPGIGPQSANRILDLQNNRARITKLEQLKNLGVVLKRALPFIQIEKQFQSSLAAFA